MGKIGRELRFCRIGTTHDHPPYSIHPWCFSLCWRIQTNSITFSYFQARSHKLCQIYRNTVTKFRLAEWSFFFLSTAKNCIQTPLHGHFVSLGILEHKFYMELCHKFLLFLEYATLNINVMCSVHGYFM